MEQVHYQFFYGQIVRQGTTNFNAEEAIQLLNLNYSTNFTYTEELDDFFINVIQWLENDTPDYDCITDFAVEYQ